MADNSKTVRRILHFKMRTPTAETKQLLPFIKAAIPFYEAFGRTRIRLLHNVDDPTQFVQVVEYETEEALEMNRQRIAGDPTLRAFLQTWRTLLSQAIEIAVAVAIAAKATSDRARPIWVASKPSFASEPIR